MGGRQTVIQDNPVHVQRCQQLQAQVNEKDKSIQTMKTDIDALRNTVSNANSENDRLKQRQAVYEREMKNLSAQAAALSNDLERHKIKSLGDLSQADEQIMNQVVDLVNRLPRAVFPTGVHAGIFGISGVGKSTTLKKLSGISGIKTGKNQTTAQMVCYKHPNSSIYYYDIPGQTDEIKYLTAEYVGTLKSLNFLAIMTTRTSHEMSALMKILDRVGIRYCLVVNKLEDVNSMSELQEFKRIYEHEIRQTGLHPQRVYYISAKFPGVLDWNSFAADVAMGRVTPQSVEQKADATEDAFVSVVGHQWQGDICLFEVRRNGIPNTSMELFSHVDNITAACKYAAKIKNNEINAFIIEQLAKVLEH